MDEEALFDVAMTRSIISVSRKLFDEQNTECMEEK
jgi:hypothetical protein